ncbi:cell envelope integrity protein CreD [Phreatobacter aquaticus]|uniref:Cell envelope integrity protein CreD n=1 Tax=Phreatobacter aquaticus TaxID=2570229 RepID=A0A4D7QGJ6_9HYPH|nr:cell envelope integrity protein CreD [Phreatobacter aquaticus]QCK86055.1 cell envelope integrity protein CreD [Phreatobacter aquaticus]
MADRSSIFRSPLFKLAIIGVLTLLMVVPLVLLSGLRGERSQRAAEVVAEVAGSWASEQTLVGPILLLPYVARGGDQNDMRTVRRVMVVLPETLKQDGEITTEGRRRGIFEIPVWRGQIAIEARFGAVDLQRIDPAAVAPVWEEAAVVFNVSDPRGLEREVSVRIGDQAAVLEPGGGPFAFQAPTLFAPVTGLDGSQPFNVSARFDLKGSRAFGLSPIGRTSTIALRSNWAHPSFFGTFLPTARDVSEAGFTASWSVPHYARPVPQTFVADATMFQRLVQARSGVRFFQPVDVYHLVERALKYGILVIGAAFIVVFLMEITAKRPFHPVQYLLVGVALAVFYLLLLSFAEHIGFAAAYALATAAIVGLVALYVGLAFGRLREGLMVGAELLVAYGLLYTVLRSEDYALLTGSVVVFVALAAVMLITVKTDWSALSSPPRPQKPAAEPSTMG